MEIQQRIERYAAIEEYRKRPLVVYATSTRVGIQAQMASDSVREFIDQLDAIDTGDKNIDILIHSSGGDALTAWKLMSILRERFDNVAVLVPFVAFSAATMFALGADEIVLHPHASLGPIDPQITTHGPDGNPRHFSFEDVGAFLRFISEEVSIRDQKHLSAIMDTLFGVVDPIVLGSAKRASELSTVVGERLLQTHMRDAEKRTQARQIAENLNKTFFSHGDAVSRSRARDLQLQIRKDDEELEQLMWDAYLGIEGHMELRRPFDLLKLYLSDEAAAESLRPRSPVSLPPNTPPEAAQQVWNLVIQQALQNVGAQEVEYCVVNALIESPRRASEYRTRGRMSATRLPDGKINVSPLDTEAAWREIPIV